MKNSSQDKTVGVIGLGLMGSSITTALAISDYRVIALAPISADLENAPSYLTKQLNHASSLNLLDHPVEHYLDRITLTEDYKSLKNCSMVVECVIEDRNIKSSVYQKIEAEVADNTIIGTNTSAIPISSLQQYLNIPERFMGIHWAEPAYATRFLEITCGEKTDPALAISVSEWAQNWNKEPTLLRKDIRGFITNRLMYAVYREALSLQNQGLTSFNDLDKATRYDMGSWIPLMGLFRRMDYMGLKEEITQLGDLLPELSNREDLPSIMHEIVQNKHRGIHSKKGIFTYTDKEAEQWKQSFSRFNGDMYILSDKYTEQKRLKIIKENHK